MNRDQQRHVERASVGEHGSDRTSPPVLLVTEIFPPAVGGSGELFANIYSRLGDIPVKVMTVARGPSSSPVPGIQVLRTLPSNLPWHVTSADSLLRHWVVMRAIWPHTKNTVVHCGRVLPEGLGCYLTCIVRRTPYVCWTHGEELAYIGSSRELRTLARRVHSAASALIANSNNTRQMLREFGAPEAKIRVVYPGVDTAKFNPHAPGASVMRERLLGSGDTLLLTVGRLQRRKGHDLVIQAVSRLRSQYPGLRYAIVGDGEERSRLEELARASGVGSSVHFAGAVPAADLPACYAAADVFVHPNRVEGADFEGFGIVFLEAAASGLPVIAGRTGGAPEAVLHDQTGVLVSGYDVPELTQAIADLLEAPARRRSLGGAGRARVVSEFTWERAAATLLGIHHDVSQRRPGHG